MTLSDLPFSACIVHKNICLVNAQRQSKYILGTFHCSKILRYNFRDFVRNILSNDYFIKVPHIITVFNQPLDTNQPFFP